MGFGDEKPGRLCPRLEGYDYSSPGRYFVTIATHDRACLFGEVVNGTMVLSVEGWAAGFQWARLSRAFPSVRTDAFQIMPNHVHGIIVLKEHHVYDASWSGSTSALPEARGPTLSEVVRTYKLLVTRMCHESCKGCCKHWRRIWQRSFWDRIIRDEEEYENAVAYIRDNPGRWSQGG